MFILIIAPRDWNCMAQKRNSSNRIEFQSSSIFSIKDLIRYSRRSLYPRMNYAWKQISRRLNERLKASPRMNFTLYWRIVESFCLTGLKWEKQCFIYLQQTCLPRDLDIINFVFYTEVSRLMYNITTICARWTNSTTEKKKQKKKNWCRRVEVIL